MDRNLLERMKAPFEHMLRNALAHGIETPEERSAAGKPAEGTVNIAVSREATEVVLRVSDDGRGMDREAIRAQGDRARLAEARCRAVRSRSLRVRARKRFLDGRASDPACRPRRRHGCRAQRDQAARRFAGRSIRRAGKGTYVHDPPAVHAGGDPGDSGQARRKHLCDADVVGAGRRAHRPRGSRQRLADGQSDLQLRRRGIHDLRTVATARCAGRTRASTKRSCRC